jgi:tetratricopeptide (TPR) repeat protein
MFGPEAGGHHLINVLLHAASSVILFLALRRLTGATWRSGLVAALFCLHPGHVESVAWVAERKDVLSGLFFGLTLWAYAAYAQSPFSWIKYLLVVVLFALGLLSKAMLVTVPFLLLLLDFWPLGRLDGAGVENTGQASDIEQCPSRSPWMLVLEKLPLFGLSAASCAVTYLVQQSAGAMAIALNLPLRLQMVFLGYGRYLAMLVWPFDLAVPYPRDLQLYAAGTAFCGLALAAVSVIVLICCRQQCRYVLVGWFWFVGMLVPVIGLVVVGDQAIADRYTYLPYTGLFIALVWGAADLTGLRLSSRLSKARNGDLPFPSSFVPVLGVLAGLVLLFFGVRSIQQTRVWRNSTALYTHALEVTKDNRIVHTIYGRDLMDHGKWQEAEDQFHEALRIDPENPVAHNNLGLVQREKGDLPGAINEYKTALNINPNLAVAHSNLAVAYGSQHRMVDAENESREALRLDPDYSPAENNLGIALVGQGRCKEAIPHYRRALEFEPQDAQIRKELAVALFGAGMPDEGIDECKKSIELNPDDLSTHHELAKIYHSLNRLREAFEEWKIILERQPGNAAAAKGLGMVLVKSGHGADAIPYLRVALAAAPQDLETRKYLVFAHVGAKQMPEALAEFREVRRQDPKDTQVLAGAARTVAESPKNVFSREFKANVHLILKQTREAMVEYREILRLDPNNAAAMNALAYIEATHPDAKLRNGKEAVELAEKVASLMKDDQPTVLDTLAAAYAESGRFKEAVATARKAQHVAEKTGNRTLIDGISERARAFEAGKPFRDATLGK